MFYRVMKTYEGHPNPHQYGYETHNDLVTSIRRLIAQYGGMTGECLATNKAQLLLRFRNRHGGLIGQAWIYHFMLQAAPPPPYWPNPSNNNQQAETEQKLDRIYGGFTI